MVSEKPWSDFSEADYTPEQWHAACLIHQHEGAPTSKDQCKLPVRTPSGEVNRNGVHAAAAALAGARGGVDASSEEKAKAAKALRGLYSQLDEEPPDSLKHHDAFKEDAMTVAVDDFLAHYGIQTLDLTPEEEMNDFLAHYGIKGMRWGIRRTPAQLHAGTSEDAARANEIRAKIQSQGLSSLSNQEVQHLVQRMNLEQQYSRLTAQPNKIAQGKAHVDNFFQTANTVNTAIKFINSPAGKLLMDKVYPNKREGGPPKHYKESKKKGKKK